MLSMHKWHQIKILRDQNVGVKKIAKRLNISRNTVKKYLLSPNPPKFQSRIYEKKIDPYRSAIDQMLEKGYIGTRIYEELKEQGYKGSIGNIYRYIKEYKKDAINKQLSTTRVETAPGQQMQYDWKEWILPVSGQEVKIYIHSVVLGFSRMKYYTFSLRITTQDIIRAIESAIHFFGGNARKLVIDNPRQMVITHSKEGIVRYNDEFLKFCGLYGLTPSACQNYRPRTKGKVERPFFYLQEHLLRGLSVEALEEFDRKLISFTDSYNNRFHKEVGDFPSKVFVAEQKELIPVCQVDPAILYDKDLRKVTNDGYVSFGGGFYPVGMSYCCNDVLIESILGRTLKVYDKKGALISEHNINISEDGKRPPHPEHEEINQGFRQKKESARSAIVESFIILFGETGSQYLQGLRESVGLNFYWHLNEIISFCVIYPPDEVERVIELSIQTGAYHKNTILRLLDPAKLKAVPVLSDTSYIGQNKDITRKLSDYVPSNNKESVA